MYLLEVKGSAVEANRVVADLVEGDGPFHEFDSRAAAEDFARHLSESGGRVSVQASAPQDPTEADGYLVRDPVRYQYQPKDSGPAGMTFDVGANLYGELGRALVYGSYGVSPALRYYFYEEVEGVGRETHRLNAVGEPYFPDDFDADTSWSPDLLVRTYRRGLNELDGRYFCEIKSGDASFQRGQLEDMHLVARQYDVLKIRVDIRDLPATYTVSIDPVASGE